MTLCCPFKFCRINSIPHQQNGILLAILCQVVRTQMVKCASEVAPSTECVLVLCTSLVLFLRVQVVARGFWLTRKTQAMVSKLEIVVIFALQYHHISILLQKNLLSSLNLNQQCDANCLTP